VAVTSRRSRNFKKLYAALPAHIQALAVKNYLLWRQNPRHPSLRFKPVNETDWSIRVGDHHRSLGAKRPDGSILWYWIGTHEACNKLLGQ